MITRYSNPDEPLFDGTLFQRNQTLITNVSRGLLAKMAQQASTRMNFNVQSIQGSTVDTCQVVPLAHYDYLSEAHDTVGNLQRWTGAWRGSARCGCEMERRDELVRLERKRQQLLDAQARQQAEVARLAAARDHVSQIEIPFLFIPLDPVDREHFYAAYKHLSGIVAGFIHTLAELDFGEEAVLLGAPSTHDNRLDDSLQAMRNQLEPCAREVLKLPEPSRGPLSDAIEEICAILTPRPAHIARLVGQARLHLDLRFVHVNMQRLSVVSEKLKMELIYANLRETALRQYGE